MNFMMTCYQDLIEQYRFINRMQNQTETAVYDDNASVAFTGQSPFAGSGGENETEDYIAVGDSDVQVDDTSKAIVGVVRWYQSHKGFGVIRLPRLTESCIDQILPLGCDSNTDFFVHKNHLEEKIYDAIEVEFIPENNGDRWIAKNVRRNTKSSINEDILRKINKVDLFFSYFDYNEYMYVSRRQFGMCEACVMRNFISAEYFGNLYDALSQISPSQNWETVQRFSIVGDVSRYISNTTGFEFAKTDIQFVAGKNKQMQQKHVRKTETRVHGIYVICYHASASPDWMVMLVLAPNICKSGCRNMRISLKFSHKFSHTKTVLDLLPNDIVVLGPQVLTDWAVSKCVQVK